MTKEEAFKINELYREIDLLKSANKIQTQTIEKLEAENKLLSVAVNVEKILNRIEIINKKKE